MQNEDDEEAACVLSLARNIFGGSSARICDSAV